MAMIKELQRDESGQPVALVESPQARTFSFGVKAGGGFTQTVSATPREELLDADTFGKRFGTDGFEPLKGQSFGDNGIDVRDIIAKPPEQRGPSVGMDLKNGL